MVSVFDSKLQFHTQFYSSNVQFASSLLPFQFEHFYIESFMYGFHAAKFKYKYHFLPFSWMIISYVFRNRFSWIGLCLSLEIYCFYVNCERLEHYDMCVFLLSVHVSQRCFEPHYMINNPAIVLNHKRNDLMILFNK